MLSTAEYQPDLSEPGFIYVLEFSKPLGNERHSARYYVGWARDVETRVNHHRKGSGAAITRAAAAAGIAMNIIYVMPGTRHDERRVKNQKNTRRWVQTQLRRQAERTS